MTTYNGSDHIQQQLDSLLLQTIQPDEVLIFDDRSSDNTAGIIAEFIDLHHLGQWHLTVNSTRLGWKRNFIEGIRKASGELIFLCDQDDRWHPEKTAKMKDGICSRPEILLLACDLNVIYEPGAMKYRAYNKTGTEKEGLISRYIFKKSFFMNPRPGCSYVFRKSFFDDVSSLWFEGAHHDEFLWLMATVQDGAYFYNEPLMDYIRYANNASGIRYKDIALQMDNLDYIAESLHRLKQFADDNPSKVTEDKREMLCEAAIWCEKRKQLMSTRNPLRWFMLFPWWGFYNSPRNCLSDLFLVLFGRFRRNSVS